MVEYLVTAMSGRPLASFETAQAANAFRDARSRANVRTRLFRVEVSKREIA